MKTFILTLSTLMIAASSWAVNGTFIQLNRSSAEKTVEDWADDLKQMADVGIDTLIVQWSSEPPVMYFDFPTKTMTYITETYPVLEKIFEANQEHNLDVYLGLQNNPLYWSQIKGRDRVLRDFFLLRISRNERIQKAMLNKFSNESSWVGYYIPDEIDDFTWRHENKRPIIQGYLRHLCERLRDNDDERKIAVSAFFRGRTAPNILADNLLDIVGDSQLDYLLIQDGVGVGDPPVNYVPFYFKVLVEKWNDIEVEQPPIIDFVAQIEDQNEDLQEGGADDTPDSAADNELTMSATDESDESGEQADNQEETSESLKKLPELWVVIEAFKQTSKSDEPFTAKPTSPTQLKKQLRNSKDYFENKVYFTFQDYMDPDLGKAGKKLYKTLKEIHEKEQAKTP